MPTWSHGEIDSAFRRLAESVGSGFAAGDRQGWLAHFTPDVVVRDWGFGFNGSWDTEIRGRDAVEQWLQAHFSLFPHNAMSYWPVSWHMVDSERGWVTCEWRNRMPDPGTGEVIEEKSYSRFEYAGDGLWRFAEHVYNGQRMRAMMQYWIEACQRAEAAGLPRPPLDDAWGHHLTDAEEQHSQHWSRGEIEAALEHFAEVCMRAFVGGDHEAWVQCFTPDVIYRELGFGFDGGWKEELRGRDQVRAWINAHCAVYPIDQMKYFPISWSIIDAERGWVVLEWLNQMADPGDGSHYELKSYTRLKYGGNGQWCFEEDIYDPMRMRDMVSRWLDHHRHVGG